MFDMWVHYYENINHLNKRAFQVLFKKQVFLKYWMQNGNSFMKSLSGIWLWKKITQSIPITNTFER